MFWTCCFQAIMFIPIFRYASTRTNILTAFMIIDNVYKTYPDNHLLLQLVKNQ